MNPVEAKDELLDDSNEIATNQEIYDHSQYFKNQPITPTEQIVLSTNTEHAVAQAFTDRFAGNLKFDHHSNNWLRWTGSYWALESTGLVAHYCRLMSAQTKSPISQRSSFVSGVERFCKNDPIFSATSDEFDQDNYLLNCPVGTINLLTGEMLEHDPANLITNITSCSPKGGYGNRFPQFLDEITCKDFELQIFLQTALGACLSGALEDHWLMFWIGTGRNGKNTLGDAVMRVLGSYARKIPSSTLMKTKYEGHPTDIANLKGIRLGVASEVEATSYWSESRINELTGDGMLSARYMRCDLFQFRRTFKLLVYGNHRPRLNSVTQALQSRIKMVRFSADFTGDENKPDPDLPEKLQLEDGYILSWLIDGHLLWLANGKKLPHSAAIANEVKDYIDSQATPENWMDECLDQGGDIWMGATDLYRNYTLWKESRSEHAVSMTVLGDAMTKRFKKKRGGKGFLYAAALKAAVVLDYPKSAG